MATKPIAPSGDFALKNIVYAEDGLYVPMTDNEMTQGRNNTGESETALGSMPDAQKDNYLFRYMTEHINYLTKMVQYLESEINTLKGGA